MEAMLEVVIFSLCWRCSIDYPQIVLYVAMDNPKTVFNMVEQQLLLLLERCLLIFYLL
ncbi:MAG: hypothetical protein ACLR43_04230 [Faecalibacillus faecis]